MPLNPAAFVWCLAHGNGATTGLGIVPLRLGYVASSEEGQNAKAWEQNKQDGQGRSPHGASGCK